ncbi:MAG TPA: ATP-binding protein [Puia sp.]|nr:ATP-binding protein [Puia sp.]
MGNKLVYGVVVASVSVLVIVVLSIWQYRRIQDTGVVIRHANQILNQTQAVQNASTQYELNVKNFLLTGDSSFLRMAGDTLAVLPGEISSLKTLASDNPVHEVLIDSLLQFAGRNSEALREATVLSRAGDLEGTAKLIADEAKSGFSHKIQGVLMTIEGEERRLVDIRRSGNLIKASELQWVLWALSAAVVMLALVTFRKIRLDLIQEKQLTEQLHRFNTELEAQVRLQTANLKASEDKYKTLFYKSPLPKWIYDEESLRFMEVNDAATRLYGYPREAFLQMTLRDIRPSDELAGLQEDMEAVKKNPLAYHESIRRHKQRSGELMDVLVTGHPIMMDGRRARMVAVVDITEGRRQEEQLRLLNADLGKLNADLGKRASELASSNAELERFAYIASHDLQEPLRMVSSFLQLLQKRYKGQLDPKADQYIHFAVDGAERMKVLIMDLLEYSRVGSSKDGFGEVDTAEIVQEVGDIFREKIIAARAQVDIDPLPKVWGDKVQLMQLFQNLLSNALKYHSEKLPSVRVHAGEEASHWLFSVKDNGIGIDTQFFDKIFIIFQRLHNKSDYSGTGIGLAICKKIVERHGGRIWVESRPGEGSTFYFTISKKA